MKKALFTGIIWILMSTLYAQQQELPEGYVILGKITGDYQGKVYLAAEDGIGGAQTLVDSCEVVNGEYLFKGGNVEGVKMHYIVGRSGNYTPFFLENGEIRIRGNADDFYGADVRGTVNNEILHLYNLRTRFVQDSIFACAAIEELKTGEKADRQTNYKQHQLISQQRRLAIEKELAMRYADQVFAPLILVFDVAYHVPLTELKQLRGQLSPSLSGHPYVQALDEYIEVKDFKVGSQAYAFRIPGINGKELRLADYRGKYVLLDFWASWCGPCRRLMPEVVELYRKYKGKHFEIIGISLDSKADVWKKAVKEMKMSWPQGSDLRGWNCEVARRYNVHTISSTVLLNPEGKVEALNLRGEELESKVKDILSR